MNVRAISGGDFIRFGLGDAAITIQSYAMLYRPMADENRVHFADASQFTFFQFSGGILRTVYGANLSDSGSGPLTADDWAIAVVRKATGTSTPRYSTYDFSTDTWGHGDGSGSFADATASTGGYDLGRAFGGGNPSNLRVLAVAIWAVDPFASDAAVETLDTGLAAWSVLAPSSLWGFDQASTATDVLDLGSNNADQTAITGTTVVDDTDISFNMALVGPPLTVPRPMATRLRPAAFAPGLAR